MDDARLRGLRQAYADELTQLAPISYAPLTGAFAHVPRERFVGPGPWTTFSAGLQSSLTPDDDPAHIYRNVLVSLDAAKKLNNGEPRFWAVLFERLRPAAGERAIHVGAGTGYYTALIAEMVGPRGRVTGIEFEPDLAARARDNLAPWPNVELLAGDGMALAEGEADVIVASCGLDHVPLRWIAMLNDSGRLLIPLTTTLDDWPGGGWGVNLLVTRHGDRFPAECVGSVGIYHCMSGRTEAAGAALKAALESLRADVAAKRPLRRVASLRLAAEPDDSCWLAGDGWWLSTSPP
ncbi:MAG TPA: methyltransferase domain-containing protein [Caulobacteraceae bacterium]|jgi:protein-L-isoaspartate(D-aspartate) O-methyltransferase|nr:methyltransferase domain-containing protein [Caulobacteraceae bacterium]